MSHRENKESTREIRRANSVSEDRRLYTLLYVCERLVDIKLSFDLKEEIGHGASGIIRKCEKIGIGNVAACKTIPKSKILSQLDLADLRSEIRAMRALKKHPFVVSLQEVYEDDNSIHLVMDYCPGGDLFDRIKSNGPFSEAESAQICQKVAAVLLYAHSKGIMHRDIKPENILMASKDSNTDIRLADFGSATLFRPGQKLNQLIGSPLYIAPSVLSHNYGTEADLWSLGVVLYILLSGVPPFWGRTNADIFRNIQTGIVNIEHGKMAEVSPEAKRLLMKLLNRSTEESLSASDVLNDPWIRSHCTELPEEFLANADSSQREQYSLNVTSNALRNGLRRSEADAENSTAGRDVLSKEGDQISTFSEVGSTSAEPREFPTARTRPASLEELFSDVAEDEEVSLGRDAEERKIKRNKN